MAISFISTAGARRILFGVDAAACLFLFISSLLACGCEEDLNLRDDFPEPFTMYGVLSPDLDTQSVRVYPLEDFPTLALDEPHGITFISTDLDTGERLVWRDTVLIEPNGQHDLVFWAPFRAEFEHRYRVEATRQSDGASSRAEVRIPPPVTVRFEELESTAVNEVDIRVFIEGEGIRVLLPEVVYKVKASGASSKSSLSITRTYHAREEPSEQGWEFIIDLYLDRYWVQGEYVKRSGIPLGIWCNVLDLLEMDVHLIVGNAVWDPPNGSFDPNLLSHHRALNNVENGLGFVGGGYRIAESLYPSRAAVEKACFSYAWSFE